MADFAKKPHVQTFTFGPVPFVGLGNEDALTGGPAVPPASDALSSTDAAEAWTKSSVFLSPTDFVIAGTGADSFSTVTVGTGSDTIFLGDWGNASHPETSAPREQPVGGPYQSSSDDDIALDRLLDHVQEGAAAERAAARELLLSLVSAT